MNRRLPPVLRVAALAALAAALGCADLREPLIIGEGYSDAPSPLPWLGEAGEGAPTGKGGGPSDNCHEGDIDLGDPDEVPEGYDEGDDTEYSPAHPQHLRDKKKRGFEEKL